MSVDQETPTRVQYQAEEWQPGEPLWEHPWRDDGATHTVRFLFDVFDDCDFDLELYMMRCDACGVLWHAYEGGWTPGKPPDRPTGAVLTCWMCGERGKYPSER